MPHLGAGHHACDRASAFQITFTLSDTSPLQALFLLAPVSPVMQIRIVLFVTMNYLPQVLIDGIITHHQIGPAAASGHSTLTVSGEDLTAVMKLITLPGLPYPAMPAEARVALILAKYAAYGVVPLIVPSVVPDIPIPVERIPTQQGNDYDYLRLLAELAGYVFYLDPGPLPGTTTAYWGPGDQIRHSATGPQHQYGRLDQRRFAELHLRA